MLAVARCFFAICAIILVACSIQFLAPSFSVHMRKYGFSPTFIGLCFAIPGIIYGAISPLMYLLTERLSKRAVIIIGTVMMSIGMMFVGTSKLLGFDNNPAIILMGMMIIGSSAGMISIPVLPEMLEAIEVNRDLNYNPEDLENYLSGIFVVATGIGEGLGPILSSFLNEGYGFRTAQDIFAVGCLGFAFFYFIMVGHFYIFCEKVPKTPGGHVEFEDEEEKEEVK